MRSRILAVMIAASALIIQSCSKTEYAPKTQKSAAVSVNPIASSTGLQVINVGQSGIFQILSSQGGVAEIGNASTKVGGTADVNTYAGTAFQKWKITKVSDSYFTIMNVGSGMYLQSYNYKGVAVAIQNTFNNTDAQLWSMVPVSISNRTYKAVNKADGLAATNFGTGVMRLTVFTNQPSQIWGYNNLPGTDTLKAKAFALANILGSNMVIQRDKPFNVWGTASPLIAVSVKVSWNANVYNTAADASGKWLVTIPAAPANATPQTLIASVTGQRSDTLTNILIGDVWIGSGQSNMVMPMTRVDDPAKVFGGMYGVENYQAEIAAANHPLLRYTRVPPALPSTKQNDIGKTTWSVCTPATAANYSALCYYFGEKIDSATNVPIGMVMSAVSNTGCEVWVAPETFQANPDLQAYYTGKPFVSEGYNGMIYPLQNLSIKGFIWDQGENNAHDSTVYTKLNSAMITQWRGLFNQGQLPFYFVQMTPLNQGTASGNYFYAKFREAQADVRTVTPKTGFAVAIDIADFFVIHYTFKEPVADRLARLAMHNDYGLNVPDLGPSYKSWSQTGATVTINFDNANGLKTIGPFQQVFFVAGADKVFYQATATISGTTIVLTLPSQVTTVAAIRYAFTNTAYSRLYNGDNLPVEPFRTDNWQ